MDINFPDLEKKTLNFWKKDRTFEKSIGQRKRARNFVFYEGPPTANGRPGIHHVLSRIFKDIVCRYKTMRGFKVLRKAGWDTHGLPVELEIEKKLGLKNKKDIEKYGIGNFNKLCRESVWQYKKDWEDMTERIAYWLDLKNPYVTYERPYMETVWWIIKQIFLKGLLYQDYKIIPYCPRCGTGLSSHEVALGYKTVKDNSVYVKIPLRGEKNTYLLVWTTTPWTLPGNVAVALNPDFVYVKAKTKEGNLILAKERLDVLKMEFKVLREFKGKTLLGKEYEPVFNFHKPDKRAWFVLSGDFVSLKEGTGLVHIAPAFGEEDMEVGKENDLPVLLNVLEDGKFKKEVKPWAGLFVKDADPLIVEDLKKKGLLFREEVYEHEYPFCWRCSSPLLYYAKQSWFINMQKVKKDLIKNNEAVSWVPSHLKKGRFGEWLQEIKDWAVTRERYWGTPLPVWQCKSCGNREVIGSLEELLSQKHSLNNYFILRHGDSLRQKSKISVCWPEKIHCPLTEKGTEQVLKSAKILKNKKIDLIFSSDLLRTKQTAQIVSGEVGAKVIFDKRLREYNVGTFNGKDPFLVWEYLKKSGNIVSAKPPQGESLLEIRKRMYGFIKDVNEKYHGKNILIVSHELPLTIFEGALKAWPLERILEWRRCKKESKIETGEWRKIEFKNLPYNEEMDLDFHRPYIDEVKFYCPKCQKNLMARVAEVIDCWFDSGSMPFAQYHYPFENKDLIDKKEQFPADYISEAIDQTRGWFYTLLAISTLLGKGTCYKNVISLGHVLDEKGEKMSKSKGNIVVPQSIIEKYGADTTRWYFFTLNQPGDAKLFSEKDVDLALKKFILTLWNSLVFFETYKGKAKAKTQKSKNILDKWIVSKINSLVQDVTKRLDNYDVTGAARIIEGFTVEDLSQWYIRRSRRRFQKPDTKKELDEASQALGSIFLTLSKLTAPFIPFLSEEINQKLGNKKSVHLEDWPKANAKMINNKLEKEMTKAREAVALSLAERAKAGIKVRQPLPLLQLPKSKSQMSKDMLDLIKEEVNVKKISFGVNLKLDTKISNDLKEEGVIREIIRNIQEMRKRANLKPQDEIQVRYSGSEDLNRILSKNAKFILKEAKVKDLVVGERPKRVFAAERELKVDGQTLWMAIKKI